MIKISNLIKIILLSTILLPYFMASAQLFEVQKLKKACEKKNDAEACFKAGKLFLENTNPEYRASIEKEANKMFTKGCELGNVESCGILADKGDLKAAMKAGDLSKDKDGKRKYYGKACEGEELKGCEALCLNKLFDDKLDGCMKMAELTRKKATSDEATDEENKWYLKACDNGNMKGCALAAVDLKDPGEQKKLLDKSCLSKEPVGCYLYGLWLSDAGDLKSAEYFLTMACNLSYIESCESAKEVRAEIAEISNKEAAAKMAPLLNEYKAACDKGDLNQCIQHGLQMVAPPDQKLPWFKKACDGGVMEGCFQIGKLFGGLNFFIQACNGGHIQGCFEAGLMSSKGNKPADAKKYFLLGCDGGYPIACNNLGFMEFKKGNQAEASKFYTKACDGGNTTGCNNLASLQIDWNNIAEARKYLNEACDSGSNAACQKLVTLTKAGM